MFYVQPKVITKQFLLLWTEKDSTQQPYVHIGQHCAGDFGTAV
jgi:hypothetical protein